MKSRSLLASTQANISSRPSLHWKSLVNYRDRLWQALFRFAEGTQELKVTWRSDRQCRSNVEIYDFSTGKHHRFNSEQEARIWLDRDRFQQPKA